MINQQTNDGDKNGSISIRFCKTMKAGTTADNGDNLCVIRHSGSKIDNGYEDENRHKGHYQIDNPIGIVVYQKIGYCKATSFYSG